MNLISYKNSWDIIKNIFQQTYGENFKENYFNLKNFLFNTSNEKTIFYMDTMRKNGHSASLAPFSKNSEFTLVFNNTVTDICSDTFLGGSNLLYWTYVFKHSLNEIGNINFVNTEGVTFTAQLFFGMTATGRVIVPEGLKQDYIDLLFSQMQGWDESYADKIYEGDEFTELEEANN